MLSACVVVVVSVVERLGLLLSELGSISVRVFVSVDAHRLLLL